MITGNRPFAGEPAQIGDALDILRAHEIEGARELTEMSRAFGRALRSLMWLQALIPIVLRPWWPRGYMLPVVRVRWYWWFHRRRVREWRAMCAQASERPGQFQLGFCL